MSASAVADAAEMQAVASSVNCPNNFVSVVDDVPITVVFDPSPTADLPITMELVFPNAATFALDPMTQLFVPVVIRSPAKYPIQVLFAPLVINLMLL